MDRSPLKDIYFHGLIRQVTRTLNSPVHNSTPTQVVRNETLSVDLVMFTFRSLYQPITKWLVSGKKNILILISDNSIMKYLYYRVTMMLSHVKYREILAL